jgi:hypothetical protein
MEPLLRQCRRDGNAFLYHDTLSPAGTCRLCSCEGVLAHSAARHVVTKQHREEVPLLRHSKVER